MGRTGAHQRHAPPAAISPNEIQEEGWEIMGSLHGTEIRGGLKGSRIASEGKTGQCHELEQRCT